jgi:hypothetical protein
MSARPAVPFLEVDIGSSNPFLSFLDPSSHSLAQPITQVASSPPVGCFRNQRQRKETPVASVPAPMDVVMMQTVATPVASTPTCPNRHSIDIAVMPNSGFAVVTAAGHVAVLLLVAVSPSPSPLIYFLYQLFCCCSCHELS